MKAVTLMLWTLPVMAQEAGECIYVKLSNVKLMICDAISKGAYTQHPKGSFEQFI